MNNKNIMKGIVVIGILSVITLFIFTDSEIRTEVECHKTGWCASRMGCDIFAGYYDCMDRVSTIPIEFDEFMVPINSREISELMKDCEKLRANEMKRVKCYYIYKEYKMNMYWDNVGYDTINETWIVIEEYNDTK